MSGDLNVVLSKLDGISVSINRVENKVDKLQEEQIRMSEKIVAIETWKQASQVEEKLGLVTESQFRLIKLEETTKDLATVKADIKRLEQFKNHSMGYAAAIVLVLTIAVNVVMKLIH
jgi:hypothetical protein